MCVRGCRGKKYYAAPAAGWETFYGKNRNDPGTGRDRPLLSGSLHGQGGVHLRSDPGVIPEGIEAQAHQSCKNVAAILTAAGSSMEKVVKTTCYLADMADFATFNAVYEQYFTQKPARSCLAARALPKGVLCEIEAIAELDA